MERLRKIIREEILLETVEGYNFERIRSSPSGYKYIFRTPDGLEYIVGGSIFGSDKRMATVEFSPEDGNIETVTNEGNPFSVTKTVVNILKDLTKRVKNIVKFTFIADEKRIKLYKRVVKREFPDVSFEKDGRKLTAYLYK